MTTSADRHGRSARLSRRFDALKSDEGYSTVESVLSVPVMVFVIIAIVEVALWWYARQEASAAADEAARVARAYAATAAQGEDRGNSYIRTVDPHSSVLQSAVVHVTRSARTVTVEVTGHVTSLIPFLSPDVDVTVTAPNERFVPSAGG